MNDSVFSSFIDQVYSNGNSMEFFDSFDNQIEVVGGLDELSIQSVFQGGEGCGDHDVEGGEGGEGCGDHDVEGGEGCGDHDVEGGIDDGDDIMTSKIDLPIKPKDEPLTCSINVDVNVNVDGKDVAESNSTYGGLSPKDIALFVSTYR